MSSEQRKSRLRHNLTCSMCLELFDDDLRLPKALPCLHNFCLECLQGYVEFKNKVLCPLCRFQVSVPPNGAHGLPTNHAVRDMLEMVQESEEGVTGGTSCSYHHSEMVKWACLPCKQPLCSLCIAQSHISLPCKTVSIYDAMLTMNSQLKQKLSRIHEIRNEIITKQSSLDEKQVCWKNNAMRKVQRKYDEIRLQLDDWKAECEKELDIESECIVNKNKEISKTLSELPSSIEELMKTKTLLENEDFAVFNTQADQSDAIIYSLERHKLLLDIDAPLPFADDVIKRAGELHIERDTAKQVSKTGSVRNVSAERTTESDGLKCRVYQRQTMYNIIKHNVKSIHLFVIDLVFFIVYFSVMVLILLLSPIVAQMMFFMAWSGSGFLFKFTHFNVDIKRDVDGKSEKVLPTSSGRLDIRHGLIATVADDDTLKVVSLCKTKSIKTLFIKHASNFIPFVLDQDTIVLHKGMQNGSTETKIVKKMKHVQARTSQCRYLSGIVDSKLLYNCSGSTHIDVCSMDGVKEREIRPFLFNSLDLYTFFNDVHVCHVPSGEVSMAAIGWSYQLCLMNIATGERLCARSLSFYIVDRTFIANCMVAASATKIYVLDYNNASIHIFDMQLDYMESVRLSCLDSNDSVSGIWWVTGENCLWAAYINNSGTHVLKLDI